MLPMNTHLLPNFIIPLLSLAVNIFCLLYALRIGTPAQRPINVLIIILAIALGIGLGLIITPVSETERTAFATYATYAATFFSGYAISKFDPIVTAALKPESVLEPVNEFRLLSFVVCFIMAVISVYVIREYVYLGNISATSQPSQSQMPRTK